jgi:hypothetical protein
MRMMKCACECHVKKKVAVPAKGRTRK